MRIIGEPAKASRFYYYFRQFEDITATINCAKFHVYWSMCLCSAEAVQNTVLCSAAHTVIRLNRYIEQILAVGLVHNHNVTSLLS